MTTLRTVLTDPVAAGLYQVSGRVPLATLRRQIEQAGVWPAVLDGDAITDKPSLLRACADVLAFPAYFGHNWDALADCLTDLAWLPAPGYAIVYDHPAPLIRHAPADWAVAQEIFRDAAAYWRAANKPLAVLLRRAAGLTPAIPRLDP
jgi:hypothetical protein